MNIAGEVLANIIHGTPVPKHTFRSPGYRPNMKFNVERFAELCEKQGLDPAEKALEILKMRGHDLSAKELLDAYTKLMEYLYPKKRAVDHSGNVTVGLAEMLAGAETEWQARKSKDS